MSSSSFTNFILLKIQLLVSGSSFVLMLGMRDSCVLIFWKPLSSSALLLHFPHGVYIVCPKEGSVCISLSWFLNLISGSLAPKLSQQPSLSMDSPSELAFLDSSYKISASLFLACILNSRLLISSVSSLNDTSFFYHVVYCRKYSRMLSTNECTTF